MLLAVSGGQDSSALLHLVLPEESRERHRLLIAHVHHGTGAHADEAEAFVRRLGEELGVEVGVSRIRVDEKQRKALGFEAAARQQRYRALEEIGDETGCALCCTAHTLDDHVESVLMALSRGAGLKGLSGIARRHGRWYRPLLGLRREQVRRFLMDNRLQALEDPANSDEAYLRVRVRRRLLPALEEVFGSEIAGSVAHSAKVVAGAEETLEAVANQALEACTVGSKAGWISIDAGRLDRYFPETVTRTLCLALESVAPPSADRLQLTRSDRGALTGFFRKAGHGDRILLHGVRVTWRSDKLEMDGLAGFEGLVMHLPGEVTLPDGTVVRCEGQPLKRGEGDFLAVARSREVGDRRAGFDEWLDANAAGNLVHIRPWREGDRFDPLGRRGKDVKVKRALRSKASEREGPLWVMETPDGRILWVLGERIARWAALDETSTAAWKMTIRPGSSGRSQ